MGEHHPEPRPSHRRPTQRPPHLWPPLAADGRSRRIGSTGDSAAGGAGNGKVAARIARSGRGGGSHGCWLDHAEIEERAIEVRAHAEQEGVPEAGEMPEPAVNSSATAYD
jgi:hypothetical protein